MQIYILLMGIVLTEHLDYNVSAKCVAQSASRALCLIIAKCKVAGGVPYNVLLNYMMLLYGQL